MKVPVGYGPAIIGRRHTSEAIIDGRTISGHTVMRFGFRTDEDDVGIKAKVGKHHLNGASARRDDRASGRSIFSYQACRHIGCNPHTYAEWNLIFAEWGDSASTLAT